MPFRPYPAAAAAAALALCAAATASAQSAGDREFLTKAIKGDNSEIMLGRIAATRGASPGIREYGRVLERDHTKAREETLPLARQDGVPATDEPMPVAANERQKLEGLNGPAFDQEFARYMVADHRHDIADFEKQARQGGPTGQLAAKILPVLHKHLAMAERLSGGAS